MSYVYRRVNKGCLKGIPTNSVAYMPSYLLILRRFVIPIVIYLIRVSSPYVLDF